MIHNCMVSVAQIKLLRVSVNTVRVEDVPKWLSECVCINCRIHQSFSVVILFIPHQSCVTSEFGMTAVCHCRRTSLVVSSCFAVLRQLYSIVAHRTGSVTRLDHCNAVLAGLPAY